MNVFLTCITYTIVLDARKLNYAVKNYVEEINMERTLRLRRAKCYIFERMIQFPAIRNLALFVQIAHRAPLQYFLN